MKNLFSLIVGLLIGALITYYFFSPTGMTTPPPLTMPSGIITPTEAKKLSDNWTNLRQQYVDSVAYEAEDNRSSWYSIKDMEYYVNYAKDSFILVSTYWQCRNSKSCFRVSKVIITIEKL